MKIELRLSRLLSSIKYRCNCPTSQDYHLYGARGIKVCEEWSNNSKSFIKWALENGYEEGLTIDRIDVNKGYSPDNCRFVNMTVQNRNRTNTRFFTINGVTKSLPEWCEIYNLNYKIVNQRINRDKRIIEEALEIVPYKRR